MSLYFCDLKKSPPGERGHGIKDIFPLLFISTPSNELKYYKEKREISLWSLLTPILLSLRSVGTFHKLKNSSIKKKHEDVITDPKKPDGADSTKEKHKEIESKEPETESPSTTTKETTFPPKLETEYKDVEFIGKGDFGYVFKAKRKSDNKVVAVEIPFRLIEGDEDSFLKGVKEWQKLDHSNIVKLFEGNIIPTPYLEMEFVMCGSLRELNKPLVIEDAKNIAANIAKGLSHAHDKKIVHNDLKPQNVLLDEKKVPKISDWGSIKTSKSVGFSLLYAAPEQIFENQVRTTDERTDIWRLGVILYELCSGKLPFFSENFDEIKNAIIYENPLPPSKLNPKAKEIEAIILKCLEKKKEDRFQNLKEFLDELLPDEKEEKDLVESLKMTLIEQKEQFKESRSSEKIEKSMEMLLDTLGRLAIIFVNSGDKNGLLDILEDLKYFTKNNEKNISEAIKHLEYLIKNDCEASNQFNSEIKNIVHKMRREWGV